MRILYTLMCVLKKTSCALTSLAPEHPRGGSVGHRGQSRLQYSVSASRLSCQSLLPAEILSASTMAATVWPAASSAGKVPLVAGGAVVEGAVVSAMFCENILDCNDGALRVLR